MSPEPMPSWQKRDQRSDASAQPTVSNRRGPLLELLARLIHPARDRIREHGRRRRRRARATRRAEPAGMPAVVIADPARSTPPTGSRGAAQLDHLAPGGDHRRAAPGAGRSARGDRARRSARAIASVSSVEASSSSTSRKSLVRLRQQRLDRLGQVRGVVVERHAEHDARALRTRRRGCRTRARRTLDRDAARASSAGRRGGGSPARTAPPSCQRFGGFFVALV